MMNGVFARVPSHVCTAFVVVGLVVLFARLLLASCSLTSLTQHDYEVESLVLLIW